MTKEASKDLTKLAPKLQQKLKIIIQDKISISSYTGKKLLGDLPDFSSDSHIFRVIVQ